MASSEPIPVHRAVPSILALQATQEWTSPSFRPRPREQSEESLQTYTEGALGFWGLLCGLKLEYLLF